MIEQKRVAFGGRVVGRVDEFRVTRAEFARGPTEVLRVARLMEKDCVVVRPTDGRDEEANVVRRGDAKTGRARILEGARLRINMNVALLFDANAQPLHRRRVS